MAVLGQHTVEVEQLVGSADGVRGEVEVPCPGRLAPGWSFVDGADPDEGAVDEPGERLEGEGDCAMRLVVREEFDS